MDGNLDSKTIAVSERVDYWRIVIMRNEAITPVGRAAYVLNPAKPLRSGRHGRLVTFFPSRKNFGAVACDTSLEADFCLVLERKTEVLTYRSRPCVINFQKPALQYTPDFSAEHVDGRHVFYEVKNNSRDHDPRWQERLGILRARMSNAGLNFEYVVEYEFRQPILLANQRRLYHYGFDGNDRNLELIENLLKQQPRQIATIARLIALGVSQEEISHLLFHRQLATNWFIPITLGSIVWCNDHDQQI